MGYRWSIRRRLILIVISMCTAIVALSVFIALQNSARTVQTQREAVLMAESHGFALGLNQQLEAVSTIPRLLASMLSAPNLSLLPDLWQAVTNILNAEPLVGRVGVIRPFRDGYQIIGFRTPLTANTTASLSRDISQALPEEPWIRDVIAADMPVWSQTQPNASVATPDHFVVAMSFGAGASRRGVVWIEIQPYALRLAMQRVIAAQPGTQYHMVFWNGQGVAAFGLPTAMADRTGGMVDVDQYTRVYNALTAQAPNALTQFSQMARDPMGMHTDADSLIVRNNLLMPGWQLISIYAANTLQNPQNQNALIVLLVMLGGLVMLGIVVRSAVSQMVSRPLMEIALAAQEIGSGDMRYQVAHTQRGDEVGYLAAALDAMQRSLADSYGRLSLYGRTLEQRVQDRTKELEAAREIAQNNAAELRALYDASIDLVSEYQLDVMLQKLVGYVRTLLRAGYCNVWLLSEDGRQLRLVATTPEHRHIVGVVITANDGLAGRVVRARKGILVDNYTNWSGRINWLMPQMHRAVGVPLLYSGSVIGAVIAGRGPLDRPFEEADQRLLNLLANLVSPIIRNAQLYGQLEDTKKKIELASEVKTRFLAGITHELRTPLNHVINSLDFMRIGLFGEVNDEQREKLDQTIRSAENLLYLINDLLDVSKIEAGEMQLFFQLTDLYPVVVDTLDAAIALISDSSPVALLADIPDSLPQIPMDARRIRQVLLNLLSNAIKFTQRGEIWLRVRVQPHHVQFEVADTGIGISKDEIDKIFQPFERAHGVRSEVEGSGLGLAISRYLVDAHGGELTVESEPGKGSVFRFSLPIDPPDKRKTATAIAAMTPEAG
jgi:signal transduction histidine kinase/HAMP domain-containing protein